MVDFVFDGIYCTVCSAQKYIFYSLTHQVIRKYCCGIKAECLENAVRKAKV